MDLKNRLLRGGLILLVSTQLGCQSRSGRHAGKQSFRYNEPSGISSLDPVFANNLSNIRACMQLYNGLVQVDSRLHVMPCIAKRWDILESGSVFVFHLRNDVYFHENNCFDIRDEFNVIHNKSNPIRITRKVVANDFLFSMKRLADPLIASPCAWVMNYVRRDSTGAINGVEAPDDTTLRISLSKPFVPFLKMLTMACFSVVPQEVVDYFGADFRSHPCGTGPFVFRDWKPELEMVLLMNENYFETDAKGKRLPYLDAVEITFIPNKEDAFIEFLKGNLDVILGVDGSFRDELVTPTGNLQARFEGKFNLSFSPYLNTEFFSFVLDCADSLSNPLCDKRIRQALGYSFYRRNLRRYLFGNIGVPGNDGIVPPGLPSYDSSMVVGYYYYASKVKSLLKEAGYEDGEGLPEIVLNTNTEAMELCNYFKKQCAEFGIRIRVDVKSHEEQMRGIDEGKFNFFRSSWIADYPDAESFLGLFYSKNIPPDGANFTHFNNADYDEIYEKAMQEPNDSIRYRYYQYMDQLLMENIPVIIVYYDQCVRIIQHNIYGLRNDAMNYLVLKNVKKTG